MPSSRLAAPRFAVLLWVCLSAAQSAPSSPPQPPPQSPPTAPADHHQVQAAAVAPATVAPNAPVITIHGYCETPKAGAPASHSGCSTVITRAQFEGLVNTLQPNMPPQVRKQLATQYPQILFMAQQARKRGLEQSPHYQQVLKFTKMQLLQFELERSLNDQSEKITDAEIADYYKKNTNNFGQCTFLRVFVPKTRQSDIPKDAAPADADAAKKNSEAAMAKIAADLRARAVVGEDFDKLQRDAYAAAGASATPPSTLNANVRRGNLPAAQAAIFDLNPGDVSGVLNDPTGFYFFKLVAKTTSPLADVKEDIRNFLRNQNLERLRQSLDNAVSAELNKDYFPDTPVASPGMPGAPRPAPANRMRPAPTTPPAQPKE